MLGSIFPLSTSPYSPLPAGLGPLLCAYAPMEGLPLAVAMDSTAVGERPLEK